MFLLLYIFGYKSHSQDTPAFRTNKPPWSRTHLEDTQNQQY